MKARLHVCVQDGVGASSGPAPGLSLCLWPWGSWLCSAPLSSGQLGQQAATRVLTRAHSAERSPGSLWPGEALWRAGRTGCAHVACFRERPQSRAHPAKPLEAGRPPRGAQPCPRGSRSSFCEMSASTKAGPTFSLTARLCMGDSGLTTPTLLCGFRVCGSWLASAGRWSWLTRAVSRSLLVFFSHTRLFDWFWGAHPHGLQSLLTHNALVCAASGGLPPYPRGLRALSFLQVGLAPGTHGRGGLAAEVC